MTSLALRVENDRRVEASSRSPCSMLALWLSHELSLLRLFVINLLYLFSLLHGSDAAHRISSQREDLAAG